MISGCGSRGPGTRTRTRRQDSETEPGVQELRASATEPEQRTIASQSRSVCAARTEHPAGRACGGARHSVMHSERAGHRDASTIM
jgi:hypothetical protein